MAQAGRLGARHHRHQHGRPRYRHPAWAASRFHASAESAARARFDVDAQEGDEEARGPIPSAADRADALTRAREICDAEQEQVLAAGGLCVIGTERHESRRIDNQLRGRSGRQGDPGVTQFYLSLEDDLMRLFGGSKMDSIAHMMEKTNQEDDMPIQAGMVSKSIESARRQVESYTSPPVRTCWNTTTS